MNQASRIRNSLAINVALISWAMLFATLFLGYAIYRSSANVWPPMGLTKISLVYPGISTLIVLISSYFAFLTRKSSLEGNLIKTKLNLNLTLFFGLGFLISQSYLWHSLNMMGLYVSSGIFASILHAFTWIHAAHVLGALIFLGYVWWVLRSEKLSEREQQIVINAEKFWHFLGIIWLVIFFALFVF
jgi:cytochrome c oxidase subunit 3